MGVREDNFVTIAAVRPGAAEPINAQCNFCESSDRNFELLSCKNKRRACLKRSSRAAAIPIAGVVIRLLKHPCVLEVDAA